jgi:hypothetical protein
MHPPAPPAPPVSLDPAADDDDAVPLLTEEVQLPPGLQTAMPGALDALDWVALADRLREAVMSELHEGVAQLLSARMAESVRAAIGPAIAQAGTALRADLEDRVSEAVDRAVSAEIQRLRGPH